MALISFEIPGRPQPQERPYVLKRGWAFDRTKSKKAKQVVYMLALEARQRANFEVSGGDFYVDMVFINPHGSSDLDNLEKLVLDGMKGVFWKDDVQVMEKHSKKFSMAAELGKTIVSVMPL